MINDDIKEILISEDEVNAIVDRIAKEITADYSAGGKYYEDNPNHKLLLLCILKGSVVFMGDLMKKIQCPVEIDFMKVSSYASKTKSSGNVNIILDLNRKDIENLNILIIEDIVDSGNTLTHLIKYLNLKGAHSVRTCTLLDKPDRREVVCVPDYVGTVIPDKFIVGYGLDYDERYRALPFIGVLKDSVVNN